nr:MAG TPA: hypothetical protein [Caudoviricetes sp.]
MSVEPKITNFPYTYNCKCTNKFPSSNNGLS